MEARNQIRKTLITAVVMIFLVYAISVPFYMHFENFSLVDSVYFVSYTITTIGYGEIAPKTDFGKLFTIFVMYSGVSIFFYHITHIGRYREMTLDKRVMGHLTIFKNLASIKKGPNTHKSTHTGFIKSIRSKIGEV